LAYETIIRMYEHQVGQL